MEFKLAKPTWKQAPVIALATTTAIATVALALNIYNQPQTITLLVPAENLAEGTVLNQGNLTQTQIQKTSETNLYLQHLKPNQTLTQPIRRGELIPKHALTDLNHQLIPLRLNNLPQIPKQITVGDRVDVWATNESQAPEPVCFNAVVSVIETKTDLSQVRTSVEIRIEQEYLESTLAVIDSNYKISLILHESIQ